MSDEDPTAATRYDWERIIRRAVVPSTVKLVALALATYADADGTRVYPGVARLVAVTSLSERSVRNALAELRRIGLIERVFKGGRHGTNAYTDVHRLAIPVELFELVDVLDPDEEPHPNRQEVPPGTVPNRQEVQSQPAPGASQPATDDVPTGTWCTPPKHLPTTHQPNYQRDNSSSVTQPQTARAQQSARLVALNGGGGR